MYKIRDVLFVHTLWIQILLAIKIWVVKIEICTFSVVILATPAGDALKTLWNFDKPHCLNP